jgi:hypothetical protein
MIIQGVDCTTDGKGLRFRVGYAWRKKEKPMNVPVSDTVAIPDEFRSCF